MEKRWLSRNWGGDDGMSGTVLTLTVSQLMLDSS